MTNRVSGSTFWFPSSDCAAQNTHTISQNKFAPSRPSPSNDLIFSGDEARRRSVAVPRSTTRTLKKVLHFRMYYSQLVSKFEGNRRSDGHLAPQEFQIRSTGIFLSYRLHIWKLPNGQCTNSGWDVSTNGRCASDLKILRGSPGTPLLSAWLIRTRGRSKMDTSLRKVARNNSTAEIFVFCKWQIYDRF